MYKRVLTPFPEGEHLEATYTSTGVLQNKYLRGVVVDEIVNGYTYHSDNANDWTNYTFHHDHLNSVTALTGHAGSTKESNRYDAFGATLNLSLPGTGNEQLFTGRQLDVNTGLYYYRARYYDSEIGRFISEDSLGFGAGVNFYAYVGNNPVNFSDPSGRITFTMNGQVSLAGWVSDIGQKIGILNAPVSSFQFGVAESFPFFDGAQRDSGTFVTGGVGDSVSSLLNSGNNLKGIGSIRLSVGISPGSVSDLAGKDIVHSGRFVLAGSYSQDAETGLFNGVTVGVAEGVSFGTEQTLTGVLSLKNGLIGYSNTANSPSINSSNAGGGFVLYPNKTNTNQMRSVYSKY